MSHPNQDQMDALVARWGAFLGKIAGTLAETLKRDIARYHREPDFYGIHGRCEQPIISFDTQED